MIRPDPARLGRRAFLGSMTAGAATLSGLGYLLTTRGAFADELARTPARTEGPFYPDWRSRHRRSWTGRPATRRPRRPRRTAARRT